MKTYLGVTFFIALCITIAMSAKSDRIFVSELFTAKIDYRLFNWTSHGPTEQFVYRPSLEGYPDLPYWMRYMYSNEHRAGFLYGTPPDNLAGRNVRIGIVALNRQNYETRQITLSLMISGKAPARNIIQMKIDNLDWVHLMDPGRIENLKNIYKKDLWLESSNDLHIVFMESAIKMGNRFPLMPQLHEGVIVHLGSNAAFSPRLKELQEEVKPLYKISTCNYKRTSVQTIFENAGFKLDWCAFKIVGDDGLTAVHHSHSIKNAHGSELSTLKRQDRWQGISKSDAPQRNYIDELAFAVAIPGMILAILIAILSGVLCFYHVNINDEKSEYFLDNVFHICTDLREKSEQPAVPVLHLSDSANHPTTTLKSLKETPNYMGDNLSLQSQSPSHSLNRESNPRINQYMRPKPPPYKPSAANQKNCVNF